MNVQQSAVPRHPAEKKLSQFTNNASQLFSFGLCPSKLSQAFVSLLKPGSKGDES